MEQQIRMDKHIKCRQGGVSTAAFSSNSNGKPKRYEESAEAGYRVKVCYPGKVSIVDPDVDNVGTCLPELQFYFFRPGRYPQMKVLYHLP